MVIIYCPLLTPSQKPAPGIRTPRVVYFLTLENIDVFLGLINHTQHVNVTFPAHVVTVCPDQAAQR